VTGVELGGLDGFALCRLLKGERRTEDAPIVFLTTGEDATIRALLVEGADCVPRPASPEVVVLRLGKLVRARRTENEHAQRRIDGLTSLARGLAHEINNPLAVALTEVSYAAEMRGGEGERLEALANAVESLQRVRHIVQRMSRLGDAALGIH
jgi:DNA-binding response OmpR family regulator